VRKRPRELILETKAKVLLTREKTGDTIAVKPLAILETTKVKIILKRRIFRKDNNVDEQAV